MTFTFPVNQWRMVLPELIHIPRHGPDSEAWVRKEAITHVTSSNSEDGPVIYIHITDPKQVFRLDGDAATNFMRYLKDGSGEIAFAS